MPHPSTQRRQRHCCSAPSSFWFRISFGFLVSDFEFQIAAVTLPPPRPIGPVFQRDPNLLQPISHRIRHAQIAWSFLRVVPHLDQQVPSVDPTSSRLLGGSRAGIVRPEQAQNLPQFPQGLRRRGRGLRPLPARRWRLRRFCSRKPLIDPAISCNTAIAPAVLKSSSIISRNRILSANHLPDESPRSPTPANDRRSDPCPATSSASGLPVSRSMRRSTAG